MDYCTDEFIDVDEIGNEDDTEDTLNECIDSTREYPMTYSASYYHRDANGALYRDHVSDRDMYCECDSDGICEYCLDTYCL